MSVVSSNVDPTSPKQRRQANDDIAKKKNWQSGGESIDKNFCREVGTKGTRDAIVKDPTDYRI